MIYDLVVVGGGAAGFFAAINSAMLNHNSKIVIIEKSPRVLQKVKISGGGRCNVTNKISKPSELSKNYPRGEDFLEKPFTQFTSTDTVNWFKQQGVSLKTEKDGRIFPISDSSQTIIDCFLDLCTKYKIEIITQTEIKSFQFVDTYWHSITANQTFRSKNLLIATGNSPAFWKELEKNKFSLIAPVPSLFTFTVKDKDITSLQGVSVQQANIKIEGSKYVQTGPVLITHWGFSGPAILKLSSSAARELNELNYNFTILINWLGVPLNILAEQLRNFADSNQKKNIISHNPFKLPTRLWKYLCEKAEVRAFQNWAESGKKTFGKLAALLAEDSYLITGKSTYKDEFVTAGGINLDEINEKTYQHKRQNGLYFAGEVLDIDGFTGGFNFQAAWTSSFLVANALTFK